MVVLYFACRRTSLVNKFYYSFGFNFQECGQENFGEAVKGQRQLEVKLVITAHCRPARTDTASVAAPPVLNQGRFAGT